MFELIDGLREAIVARIMREYYQEVQDCIGLMMCEEISIEEFEDTLDDLDCVYANKILRELQ